MYVTDNAKLNYVWTKLSLNTIFFLFYLSRDSVVGNISFGIKFC